ncbi:caspase domain-containing protein [Diplodia corticola]|uniref:Caspase domain-containing protein n=1 Tax=Diplodia corticola TaxID=236234 RepID=A0A1J9RZ14_9PEZI|nr:caspase domain-containing protein [Diplodia corticola]OJD33591.1 caspase domain-containing protein [Diplodia corticola]
MALVRSGQGQAFRVDMILPEKTNEEDSNAADDLYRAYVYIGEKPPSWDELSLPDIPKDSSRIAAEGPAAGVEPVCHDGTKPDPFSRGGRAHPDSSEDEQVIVEWTVVDFRIRIDAS